MGVGMPVLGARGVSKRFGRSAPVVLRAVDLELDPATTTVVIGANGSGKSTLLRLAVGLTRPTSGHLAQRAARVTYAPERLPAQLWMSAHRYLAHMARLQRLDPVVARARAGDLLDRLGLEPGPDVPVQQLSKGNNQKVALAQALLGPADLVVLDEPYSGLDPTARRETSALIEAQRSAGSAVLLTAHTPLDELGDARSLLLVEGTLRSATTPGSAPGSAVAIRVRATARAGPPVDLERLPAVITCEPTGVGSLTLRVERSGVDDVLRHALGAGWSIDAVVPAVDGAGWSH